MSKRFERMQCNKCKQEFPIDEIIIQRITQHKKYHMEKREDKINSLIYLSIFPNGFVLKPHGFFKK